jgi:hypothetical protein
MIPRAIFAEEHRIFREQCRTLFEKDFTPFHARWERDGIVPLSACCSAAISSYEIGSHSLEI